VLGSPDFWLLMVSSIWAASGNSCPFEPLASGRSWCLASLGPQLLLDSRNSLSH
ncbi:hypothetical protein J6590_098686, partial [Homalodisca vitripennis]